MPPVAHQAAVSARAAAVATAAGRVRPIVRRSPTSGYSRTGGYGGGAGSYIGGYGGGGGRRLRGRRRAAAGSPAAPGAQAPARPDPMAAVGAAPTTAEPTQRVQDAASAGNGEVVITPLCFLRGTHILTPTGEVLVEDLRGRGHCGHPLWRHAARQVDRPATATRRRRRGRTRRCARCASRPCALGERLPARDLFVSPGHSVLVGRHAADRAPAGERCHRDAGSLPAQHRLLSHRAGRA